MMNVGTLPGGWTTEVLGNLDVQIFDGPFGSYLKTSDYVDSGIRVIRLENIGRGRFIDEKRSFISKNKYNDIRKHTVVPGDIVFSSFVTESIRSALVPTHIPLAVNKADCFCIRLSGNTANSKFVQLFFQSNSAFKQIEGTIHGVGRPRINTSQLKGLIIPIAPKQEQTRIIAKIEELFSELDKGVEALMTVREQLKAYRQALLKHAFDGKLTEDWRCLAESNAPSTEERVEWLSRARAAYYEEQMHEWEAAVQEWTANSEKGKRPGKPERPAKVLPVSDDDVGSLPTLPKSWIYARLATLAHIGSGMSVSKDRALEDPVHVPYLRVANVQRGKLDLAQMKTMKIEKAQLPQLALKKWDVLFNEGGDRDKLGRGWVWEDQIRSCITQNHVFRASPYLASEMHAKFISYWGNTFGQEYFNTEGKQTTNLASINKGVLSAFPVPFPPMQEQAEVVREIEKRMSLYDRLQAEIEVALERQAALRQSILKLAFSGQLVTQDPRNEPASALLERVRAERAGTATKKQPATKNGKRKAA
jgi:type I restriction enzyme, S subunit